MNAFPQPAAEPAYLGDLRHGTDYGELLEWLPAVTYIAELRSTTAWPFVSPQIEQLTGYSVEEWLADPGLWFRLVHPDDRGEVLTAEEGSLREGLPYSCEYRLIHRSGHEVWVRDDATVREDAAGRRVLWGLMLDITARKRAEEKLLYLAEHDSLTGLCNRRRFFEELKSYLAWSARHGDPGAVLLLDVDGLKQVNDSLGHDAGDALLKHVAETLRGRMRKTDSVARLGGDEFVVLLRGLAPEQARQLGREIVQLIAGKPLRVAGETLIPTTSVGIALIEPGLPLEADSVVREADASMYQAKARRELDGGQAPALAEPAAAQAPAEPADGAHAELRAVLHQLEHDVRDGTRIRDEVRERYGGALPHFVRKLLLQGDEAAARALRALAQARALSERSLSDR